MSKIKNCFKIDSKYLSILLFFIVLALQTILFFISVDDVFTHINIVKDCYNTSRQFNDVTTRFGFLTVNYISYNF